MISYFGSCVPPNSGLGALVLAPRLEAFSWPPSIFETQRQGVFSIEPWDSFGFDSGSQLIVSTFPSSNVSASYCWITNRLQT